MSSKNLAVSVRNLSKAYTIVHNVEKHTSMGEALMHRMRKPLQRIETETFWALKDVSFDIHKGDVVGIIGRNGAGKSTLLKILSQIVEPSTGEICLYGRVGSLLEVGTGFHPELTGRENIFLNGAILGMRRREIDRQFDAIVDFAEVEQFLDTPVKRYSSGMYVRLAFAVAAHLNPEILIVDEVLSVGDAQFQKKCMGKMHDVAEHDGRTVLFVSHHLGAVKALCSKAIELNKGQLAAIGNVNEVTTQYLQSDDVKTDQIIWDQESAPGTDLFKLKSVRVYAEGELDQTLQSKSDILVEFKFVNYVTDYPLCIGFELIGVDGNTIFWSYQTDMAENLWPKIHQGENVLLCRIPKALLNGGLYNLAPKIGIHNKCWIVNLDPVLSFQVELTHGVSPTWTSLSDGRRPGLIAPLLDWVSIS